MTTIDEAVEKSRMIVTRDPAIIASVIRNGLTDVRGTILKDGSALCYKFDVERFNNQNGDGTK